MHNIYVMAIVCAQKKPEKVDFFCKIYFSILSKDFQQKIYIHIFIAYIYLLT